MFNCGNRDCETNDRGTCLVKTIPCVDYKAYGDNLKVDKHIEICKELNDLYARKNADYGDSFAKLRQEYGSPAILIRLEDKLGRLKRLMMGNEQNIKDENIEDTLIDLANYAIMELVERRLDNEI